MKKKNCKYLICIIVLFCMLACTREMQNKENLSRGNSCDYEVAVHTFTNQWSEVARHMRAMQKTIGHVDVVRKYQLAIELSEHWMAMDFSGVSSSRYVTAADNYFRSIDYIHDILKDASVEPQEIKRIMCRILDKYKRICHEDVMSSKTMCKDDEARLRCLKVLKKDSEENIRFFKKKVLCVEGLE